MELYIQQEEASMVFSPRRSILDDTLPLPLPVPLATSTPRNYHTCKHLQAKRPKRRRLFQHDEDSTPEKRHRHGCHSLPTEQRPAADKSPLKPCRDGLQVVMDHVLQMQSRLGKINSIAMTTLSKVIGCDGSRMQIGQQQRIVGPSNVTVKTLRAQPFCQQYDTDSVEEQEDHMNSSEDREHMASTSQTDSSSDSPVLSRNSPVKRRKTILDFWANPIH